MDLDLSALEQQPQQEVFERPKTKKELEQEKKDLELGELLELMDDWKPIVSRRARALDAERARLRSGQAAGRTVHVSL